MAIKAQEISHFLGQITNKDVVFYKNADKMTEPITYDEIW